MSDYITKGLPVTSEVYVPAIHMNSSVFIGQVFQTKRNQYENEEMKINYHGTEIPYRTECQVKTPADEENTRSVECNTTESCFCDEVSLQVETPSDKDNTGNVECNRRESHTSYEASLQNILEITICDEDSPFSDEELCTVTFDIANLQIEERVCKHFELNKEKNELLDVEFYLEHISDMSENLISNGVLLSRELCCLKVEVNHRGRKKKRKKQNFACTLRGSYEDARNILLDSSSRNAPPNHTTFHYAKYCNPKLEMQLLKKRSICSSNSGKTLSFTLPLCRVPLGERVQVANDKAHEVFVTTANCQKSLDMRLGFDLCPEEQDFICQRKKYVAAALKNVLRLEGELQMNEA
ncbi:Phospholipase A2 [Crotalus adamanteus]|uniref:Phospholipase A2 n=1 Tax=Crotalus adamanteus TaxID=8729 RepID=A0AAW1C6Y4_CROAD